ncbi:MAG TPA: hypothetical protein VMU87_14145 [Stellaceae bacterium]|nr:hypothetical protein [Stellaceae bacterium]
MSAGFRAIPWNRYKLAYDAVLVLAVFADLGTYFQVGPPLWPSDNPVNPEIQEMRAFGSCAFLMLMLIRVPADSGRIGERLTFTSRVCDAADLHEFRVAASALAD